MTLLADKPTVISRPPVVPPAPAPRILRIARIELSEDQVRGIFTVLVAESVKEHAHFGANRVERDYTWEEQCPFVQSYLEALGVRSAQTEVVITADVQQKAGAALHGLTAAEFRASSDPKLDPRQLEVPRLLNCSVPDMIADHEAALKIAGVPSRVQRPASDFYHR